MSKEEHIKNDKFIHLKNRIIDSNGSVICDHKAIIESLYSLENMTNILVKSSDEHVETYNQIAAIYDFQAIEIYDQNKKYQDHQKIQNIWLIPEEYMTMDLKGFLLSSCLSEKEKERVKQEYLMFEERKMIPILKFLKFMVDQMRKNHIVWGVGRGSSVSSYCLFLIGVHKINSIEYELDIGEFLK